MCVHACVSTRRCASAVCVHVSVSAAQACLAPAPRGTPGGLTEAGGACYSSSGCGGGASCRKACSPRARPCFLVGEGLPQSQSEGVSRRAAPGGPAVAARGPGPALNAREQPPASLTGRSEGRPPVTTDTGFLKTKMDVLHFGSKLVVFLTFETTDWKKLKPSAAEGGPGRLQAVSQNILFV